MITVWLVEEGYYSDRSVIGIFSSEANAKQLTDFLNKDNEWPKDYDITECILDPAIKELNAGLRLYHVIMQENGDTTRISLIEEPDEDDIKTGWHIYQYNKIDSKPYLAVKTWAKDEKHAVKIANEKRVQIIALNQFGHGASGY